MRQELVRLAGTASKRDWFRVSGYHSIQYDPMASHPLYERHHTRVDFKLKQKGVAFANGVSIRWADWEPCGPYPVVSFAEPPRRW